MGQIAIVILNYNGTSQTIDCIKNIAKFEKNSEKYKLIVVDNHSNDEDRDELLNHASTNGYVVLHEDEVDFNSYDRKKFILFLKENYGYAKGNNFGLKLATQMNCEITFIVNNDIILKEPLIEEMADYLRKNKKVGIVGPKIIGVDGKKQGPYKKPNLLTHSIYPLFYPVGFLISRIFPKSIMNSETNEEYPYRIMGCFMGVKNRIFEEIGYFDENTFLYAEEMIIAEKLQSRGYLTAYKEEKHVLHIHGFTTKQLGNKKKYMLNLQSDLYYFEKYLNYGKIKLFMVMIGRLTFFWIWLKFIKVVNVIKN